MVNGPILSTPARRSSDGADVHLPKQLIKTNTKMKSHFSLLSAGLFAAAALMAVPAIAQDAAISDEIDDEVVVRGQRVTIEVDDEGRVLIDGERVSDDEGPIVLRVESDDGDVEIEAISPSLREFRVHRAPPAGDHVRHRDRIVIRGDHDWPHVAGFMKDFEFEMPDLPDMAPLMERFHLEIGDPMRASFREHREVAEQEREAREIARRARDAAGSERAELEAELQAKVNEIFDKKMELREEVISDLQEEVQEEREELNRRRELRQEMIDRRMRTLLGEDDLLEW